jgi:hypothetical protein
VYGSQWRAACCLLSVRAARYRRSLRWIVGGVRCAWFA